MIALGQLGISARTFYFLGSFGQVLCVIRISSPIRCRDAADRIECSCCTTRRFTKCDCVCYWYSHLCPCRNSVLLGSQKDKFPGINLALMLDHFEDLFSFELLRSVFQAVSQN